jgi:hypothetical protein
MQEVEDEPLFCERAAGIDIGKKMIMVTIRVPSESRKGGPAAGDPGVRHYQEGTAGAGGLAADLAGGADRDGVHVRYPGCRRNESDIAQVVPSRTRPRREGQKRQRREVVAGSAPHSAVCVADGPQVTRPRQEEERAKRTVTCCDRRPSHDPGLRPITGSRFCSCWSGRASTACCIRPRRSRRCPGGPRPTSWTPSGWRR